VPATARGIEKTATKATQASASFNFPGLSLDSKVRPIIFSMPDRLCRVPLLATGFSQAGHPSPFFKKDLGALKLSLTIYPSKREKAANPLCFPSSSLR
jgi:hypothetical protein